jgi:hypothetical protein
LFGPVARAAVVAGCADGKGKDDQAADSASERSHVNLLIVLGATNTRERANARRRATGCLAGLSDTVLELT